MASDPGPSSQQGIGFAECSCIEDVRRQFQDHTVPVLYIMTGEMSGAVALAIFEFINGEVVKGNRLFHILNFSAFDAKVKSAFMFKLGDDPAQKKQRFAVAAHTGKNYPCFFISTANLNLRQKIEDIEKLQFLLGILKAISDHGHDFLMLGETNATANSRTSSVEPSVGTVSMTSTSAQLPAVAFSVVLSSSTFELDNKLISKLVGGLPTTGPSHPGRLETLHCTPQQKIDVADSISIASRRGEISSVVSESLGHDLKLISLDGAPETMLPSSVPPTSIGLGLDSLIDTEASTARTATSSYATFEFSYN